MSQAAFNFQITRRVYTVSDLTQEIRNLVEPRFLDVWVTGEVSNCRAAASGHYYFTLKDESAQLRVVCFRNQARYLKFRPQDGVALVARGRLCIYEARGEYQLVAEHLEPAGLGALQLAFEQLKQKLAAEGLFDAARKKPLPMLPRAIGVVTSAEGAVIRDILRVLRRRYRNMNVVLYPARVQGEGAAEAVAEGIRYFNRTGSVDVMIVARGGGSIEDLWAFNEEPLARAIAASGIPVISAVGHETDFTIADFVADLRAPTPSAAAEMAVGCREDFEAGLRQRERRILQMTQLNISELRRSLMELSLHHVFERVLSRLAERAQRLDELRASLDRAIGMGIQRAREGWMQVSAGVLRLDFSRILSMKRVRFEEDRRKLEADFAELLRDHKDHLARLKLTLRERSPLVILGRGYSITRDAAGNVLRDAAAVSEGSGIFVRLAKGEIEATVISKQK
ncbi:MAG TPA: exodeoxyribonuclease VII large subunit [Terriglobia bacterium]|nr:exodeoxyribonuclease VII large subunit [Terriglobia bacterium]